MCVASCPRPDLPAYQLDGQDGAGCLEAVHATYTLLGVACMMQCNARRSLPLLVNALKSWVEVNVMIQGQLAFSSDLEVEFGRVFRPNACIN